MRTLLLAAFIVVAPVLPACKMLAQPVQPASSEPIVKTLPDGSTVTVTPGDPGAPTVGSTLAGTIGGVVGALIGIPALGTLAAGAANAALKKKDA